MKPLFNKLPMNKTEAAYSELLEHRKIAGEIQDYRFEPFKLILCHNIPGLRNEMSYKPDFLVVFSDSFELHEIKGYWREDARLKIKMAAEKFPWFRFVGVTRTKGVWQYEGF